MPLRQILFTSAWPKKGWMRQRWWRNWDALGVRVLPTATDQMRAVLNYHVTAADVQRALAVFSQVMA
jgi:hypothetical protein